MICLAVIEWMKLIELPGRFNGSKLINERLANFFESPGRTETLVCWLLYRLSTKFKFRIL